MGQQLACGMFDSLATHDPPGTASAAIHAASSPAENLPPKAEFSCIVDLLFADDAASANFHET
jgi:hypothetical protein